MGKVCLCLTALILTQGCGNPGEKMSSSEEAVTFEAMQTFESNVGMAVGYPAEMGDWNEVKAAAANEDYAAGVAALESAELPAAMSDKQAARDEVISAAKKLQELAKNNGSTDEIKAAYEAMSAALSKFNS